VREQLGLDSLNLTEVFMRIGRFSFTAAKLEIGARPDAILRSWLTMNFDKISGRHLHSSIARMTRHAEKFGTLIIQNRRPAAVRF